MLPALTVPGEWQTAALSLFAALLWGGGDFSGGMAVKSAGGGMRQALRVILTAHLLSLAALVAWLTLTHAPFPQRAPLLWAVAGGAAGFAGLVAFYTALAGGAMGTSAVLSGLLAAAIPACLSSWLEGAPGVGRLGGFALAAAAMWLITAPAPSATGVPPAPSPGSSRNFSALALAGGVGFGLYFIALRFANAAGLVQAMAAARLTSSTLCLLALALWRQSPSRSKDIAPRARWLTRQSWGWALGVAVLDTAGNLFFIAATRTGRLDVAAVLSSLYPASTILLAAVLLHERPHRRQLVGMALALAAVALIAR